MECELISTPVQGVFYLHSNLPDYKMRTVITKLDDHFINFSAVSLMKYVNYNGRQIRLLQVFYLGIYEYVQ